ncbi:MAG: class I SAM-dependent methyltransferase [Bryobacteraceae bacterium]|jgi:SAM-dependent methyltransferase
MGQVSEKYLKHEFWAKENLQYAEAHFRLEKTAGIVNRIAGDKQCDLLDVGCGPATLKRLLRRNIQYHGVDIAIHTAAPNLVQADFVEGPIAFGEKRFDIIVAQGVFEYVGKVQLEKFHEIRGLLNPGGTFVVSYVNFNHRKTSIWPAYNNIQSLDEFQASLASVFDVDRAFPTSHHWYHREPRRRLMRRIQMHMNMTIPMVSRLFAVEYMFICSLPDSRRAEGGARLSAG